MMNRKNPPVAATIDGFCISPTDIGTVKWESGTEPNYMMHIQCIIVLASVKWFLPTEGAFYVKAETCSKRLCMDIS